MRFSGCFKRQASVQSGPGPNALAWYECARQRPEQKPCSLKGPSFPPCFFPTLVSWSHVFQEAYKTLGFQINWIFPCSNLHLLPLVCAPLRKVWQHLYCSWNHKTWFTEVFPVASACYNIWEASVAVSNMTDLYLLKSEPFLPLFSRGRGLPCAIWFVLVSRGFLTLYLFLMFHCFCCSLASRPNLHNSKCQRQCFL